MALTVRTLPTVFTLAVCRVRAGSASCSTDLEAARPLRGIAASRRIWRHCGYQTRGFATTAHTAMGTPRPALPMTWAGKTIQTLALRTQEFMVFRQMPSHLPHRWSTTGPEKRKKFHPELPVLIHHTGLTARKAAFRRLASAQALVITSYGLLQRDMAVLKDISWGGVILDEAQNVKTRNKTGQSCSGHPATYRIALTGTPEVENNVGDLWSLMDFSPIRVSGQPARISPSVSSCPIQTGHDPEAVTRQTRRAAAHRRLRTRRPLFQPPRQGGNEEIATKNEHRCMPLCLSLNRTLYGWTAFSAGALFLRPCQSSSRYAIAPLSGDNSQPP